MGMEHPVIFCCYMVGRVSSIDWVSEQRTCLHYSPSDSCATCVTAFRHPQSLESPCSRCNSSIPTTDIAFSARNTIAMEHPSLPTPHTIRGLRYLLDQPPTDPRYMYHRQLDRSVLKYKRSVLLARQAQRKVLLASEERDYAIQCKDIIDQMREDPTDLERHLIHITLLCRSILATNQILQSKTQKLTEAETMLHLTALNQLREASSTLLHNHSMFTAKHHRVRNRTGQEIVQTTKRQYDEWAAYAKTVAVESDRLGDSILERHKERDHKFMKRFLHEAERIFRGEEPRKKGGLPPEYLPEARELGQICVEETRVVIRDARRVTEGYRRLLEVESRCDEIHAEMQME